MRGRVIGLVLILVSLPAVLSFVSATSFRLHNQTNGSFVSAGEKRTYLLHVPRTYDRTKAAPLVISMHGAGGWPAQQMEVSRWNDLADREGFIVVYPSGVDGAPRIFRVLNGPGLDKDVQFTADLIDKLERDYNIDPTRIYANGLSNGGGMTFVLSCKMADRIAAFGIVAGAQTLPAIWCRSDRPAPVIVFHGTADPVVPFNGGVSWISTQQFPDLQRFFISWAKRNRCAEQPIDSRISAHVTRRAFVDCADGADVLFYIIRDGGHSWPSGGPLPEWLVGSTTKEIDATKEMWMFFQQHPLVRRPPRAN